jgi:putative phage-type endonuclease
MPELVPAEPRTPEWHAARRAGVTATDIVTILGLSHWDSVYSLFWRKMQQVPEVEDNDSDRFRLGRELEKYVLHRWNESESSRWAYPAGLYRHSERAWQMATLDAGVLEAPGGNLSKFAGPLELKLWADADRHSWQDAPPAQVRAQVLWQMDVMDVAVGHAGVVFLPSGEFRSYTIEHIDNCPRADGLGIGCTACPDIDLMRFQGEEFMARLRLELPPPDPGASMATLAAVRARFTRQPDKQAEIDPALWINFDVRCDVLKAAEEMKRMAEIRIREQMGEATLATVDGQPVARRVIVDAQVKAHTQHQDYLRRIEPKGDDNGS